MSNIAATDFYKKTTYNVETLNQIWMSEISDSHDIWCNCSGPFAHLLASIFPPHHKDRDLTINQILKRDYHQQCHSGGDGGENSGVEIDLQGAAATTRENQKEDTPEDNIDDLILAAAAAEEEAR